MWKQICLWNCLKTTTFFLTRTFLFSEVLSLSSQRSPHRALTGHNESDLENDQTVTHRENQKKGESFFLVTVSIQTVFIQIN